MHQVALIKARLREAESTVPIAKHAEAGAKVAYVETSSEVHDADTAVAAQQDVIADLKPKADTVKTEARATKQAMRRGKDQLKMLKDYAAQASKVWTGHKTETDIQYKAAKQRDDQARQQAKQQHASYEALRAQVSQLYEDKTNAEYQAHKAAVDIQLKQQRARYTQQQAEDEAAASQEALQAAKSELVKEQLSEGRADRALTTAKADQAAAKKHIKSFEVESQLRIENGVNKAKSSMQHAKQLADQTRDSDQALLSQLEAASTVKNEAQTAMNVVRAETTQPVVAAQEDQKAAAAELEIVDHQLKQQVHKTTMVSEDIAETQAAEQQWVDVIGRDKQRQVTLANRDIQRKADMDSKSMLQERKESNAETKLQSASQEFTGLKEQRSKELNELREAREMWKLQENQLGRMQREQAETQIADAKQLVSEAEQQAAKAKASAAQTVLDARAKIQELEETHAKRREALLKSHEKSLSNLHDQRDAALKVSEKLQNAATEARLDAESAHEETKARTDLAIKTSKSRGNAAKMQAGQKTEEMRMKTSAAEADQERAEANKSEQLTQLFKSRAAEKTARRNQRLSEAANEAANDDLIAAQKVRKTTAEAEQHRLHIAKQSVDALKEDLSSAKNLLEQQRQQTDDAQKQLAQAQTQVRGSQAEATAAQEEADSKIQQHKQEQLARQKEASYAARDAEDKATLELETTKNRLESQLQMVRDSTTAQVRQIQNEAQAHVEHAESVASGEMKMHRMATKAALERTRGAVSSARDAGSRVLDYTGAQAGFQLKTEEHLHKIQQVQVELKEHERNRQAEMDEEIREQQEQELNSSTPAYR
jgi:hypothetical protein